MKWEIIERLINKYPIVLFFVLVVSILVLLAELIHIHVISYLFTLIIAYFIFSFYLAYINAKNPEEIFFSNFQMLIFPMLIVIALGFLAQLATPISPLFTLILEFTLVPLILASYELKITQRKDIFNYVLSSIERYFNKIVSDRELALFYLILLFLTILCSPIAIFLFCFALMYLIPKELEES